MDNIVNGEPIQLTLNPDQETERKLDFEKAPELETIVRPKPEQIFSAGTIDESMLSEEEKQIVDRFASEIDISNVDQIIRYGERAQKNISDYSASILKKVKTYDLGDIGASLKELTVALDATVEPEKKGLLKVFQKAKQGVGSVMANYAKAETNVDKIEKDLQKHQTVLTQDISMYQQMYDLNVRYYKELTMYIIAGKKALAEAREGKLKELKEKAELTQKAEDAQAFSDFEDQCNRFEKRLNDLEITRVVSVQSAPQIRLLQNADRELLDKIQASVSYLIPLWRNQLVIALGIEHSRRAVDAQSSISDKTNELIAKNSEALKMASIDVAKASERPIVDIETLKKSNRDLISSINEVVKIHEQGAQKREQVHDELVKIEEELKQTLLEAEGR